MCRGRNRVDSWVGEVQARGGRGEAGWGGAGGVGLGGVGGTVGQIYTPAPGIVRA